MDVVVIINLIISLCNILATAIKSYQLGVVRQRVRIIESTPPSTPISPSTVNDAVSADVNSHGDIVIHVPSRHV